MCAAHVVQSGVAGDLVEAGVWRGGACIMLRAVLAACEDQSRSVWVVDSFAGLPPPSPEQYPEDTDLDLSSIDLLSVSRAEVEANFERYGLLDERVHFLEGWFKDTLPRAPIERIALLRVDADMYESTMDVLTGLYARVSPGGYVIIDDYGALDPCRRAVDDFRHSRGIREQMFRIDHTAVYWVRGGTLAPPKLQR
jgi:hypothetical protein